MQNILFICSRNQWCTPSEEKVYSKNLRVNIHSASTSQRARYTVNDDIIFNDIFCPRRS